MPSLIQAINGTVVAFVPPTNPDALADGDDSDGANTGSRIPTIVLPAILLGILFLLLVASGIKARHTLIGWSRSLAETFHRDFRSGRSNATNIELGRLPLGHARHESPPPPYTPVPDPDVPVPHPTELRALPVAVLRPEVTPMPRRPLH